MNTFCAALIAFGIGGYLACESTGSFWRSESVKHHAAEYYLDANHDRQFRWLDEKPKE